MGGLTDAGIPSPCSGVCDLDEHTEWCMGCGRTIREIAGWGTASNHERRVVMAALPARLAGLAKP